ncbi:hypothetical protein [Streptosporangium saharense]|uniref:Uncharacterized protein n=1 Tax=Streptosporangium saharense TaxID=1706840 RepID=A0A7W7QPJ7_9ACTN|nr:hypothetical protein [Streptosporangium saharense]MBB4917425.1 hypothetical protein [Streptosporangium saharense]
MAKKPDYRTSLQDFADEELRDKARGELVRQQKEARELEQYGGNARARDLARKRVEEMLQRRQKNERR